MRKVVDERIIPNERAIIEEDRQRKYETLRQLQGEVQKAGLWTPHPPEKFGGGGWGSEGCARCSGRWGDRRWERGCFTATRRIKGTWICS
ncbi:MAG: hypothetical protein R3F14_18330 [Polyangiaceae bacterium]